MRISSLRFLALGAIGVLLLTGCNQEQRAPESMVRVVARQADESGGDDGRDAEVARVPESLVKANNAFALDLFARLSKEQKGNLFVAPYTISAALAMTYAGARGETEKAMARTLHFNEAGDVHPDFAILRGIMGRKLEGGGELFTANALWGLDGYPFSKSFLGLIKQHYSGDLRLTAFGPGSPAAQMINDWVSEQTRGRVKNLIKDGDLDELTRLVLVSAIYFQGTWDNAFDKERTIKSSFHLNRKTNVTVPMMWHHSEFKYYRDEQFIALDLPYKGKELAMTLFLPPAEMDLSKFTLTPEILAHCFSGLSISWIDVGLPRFKIKSDFDLKETLDDMGMADAFDGSCADFSGMHERGMKDLSIRTVRHQAWVDVNEKGTEASGATAVIMATFGDRPPKFIADRPFVFLIRDLRTGSILFLGRVTNPLEKAE